MKTLVICNPVSGRNGRTGKLVPLLREFAAASGGAARLALTEGPGDATRLAEEAVRQGCTRVISVGGDGTMNGVARALVNTPVALGLLPCGSGNGLARHLRLPLAPAECLKLAGRADARVVNIDTGTADGAPFFNAMGVGLDAEISRAFNRTKERGFLTYVRSIWTTYRRHRPQPFAIAGGGRSESLQALLVSVMNSDQYGNDARVAPGARVDDGELDLISVPPVSKFAAPFVLARLYLGRFDRVAGVRHWRAPRFRIERPQPGSLHTDGETHEGAAAVEVSVLPASLRVLLPASSP